MVSWHRQPGYLCLGRKGKVRSVRAPHWPTSTRSDYMGQRPLDGLPVVRLSSADQWSGSSAVQSRNDHRRLSFLMLEFCVTVLRVGSRCGRTRFGEAPARSIDAGLAERSLPVGEPVVCERVLSDSCGANLRDRRPVGSTACQRAIA